ncbi:MAG: 50S ribosomal protein L17 [bacterium]
MRHRKVGKTLDRKKGPREALLRSLATSVILYERVQTTKAKAKAVQSMVEKLITDGRKGDLAARRRINRVVYGDNAVKKVVEELGPRYVDRNGGYTRITGVGFRQGDGAEMVQIELV